MASKSQKAADAVERLFKRKPDASTDEFLEVATAADASLKGIGKRSFNASYLLPLKRAANAGKPKKKRAKKKAAARKTTAKKGTGKRAARGRRKAAAGGDVSAAARTRVRELILERDQEVLDTLGKGGDPKAAYELGARLDGYIDALASALAG